MDELNFYNLLEMEGEYVLVKGSKSNTPERCLVTISNGSSVSLEGGFCTYRFAKNGRKIGNFTVVDALNV